MREMGGDHENVATDRIQKKTHSVYELALNAAARTEVKPCDLSPGKQ